MYGYSTKVLSVRKFKAGYEIRKEVVKMEGWTPFILKVAYNSKGQYIGDSRRAFRLYSRGIMPELASKTHNVCSIGFCSKEKKWYGWSHRAKCGFGIGNRIFEGLFGDDHTPFIKHGSKTIRTMADAKLSAKRFARSVS